MRKLMFIGMIPLMTLTVSASSTPEKIKDIKIGPCTSMEGGTTCKVTVAGQDVFGESSITLRTQKQNEVGSTSEKVITKLPVPSESERKEAIIKRLSQLGLSPTQDEILALTEVSTKKSLPRVIGITEIYVGLNTSPDAKNVSPVDKLSTTRLILDCYMERKFDRYPDDKVLTLDQIIQLVDEAQKKATPVLKLATKQELDPKETIQLLKVYLRLQVRDPKTSVDDAWNFFQKHRTENTKELLKEIPIPTDKGQGSKKQVSPSSTPSSQQTSSPQQQEEKGSDFLSQLLKQVGKVAEKEAPKLLGSVGSRVSGAVGG